MKRRLWLPIGLAMVVGLGCSSDDDDDDFIPEPSTDLNADDVSVVGESVGAALQVNFSSIRTIPFDTTPSFDDDCVDYNPPNPEVNPDGSFEYDIVATDCTVGEEEDDATVSGTMSFNGSWDPEASDYESLVEEGRSVIDNLDEKIADSGPARLHYQSTSDYTYQSGLTEIEMDVSDAEAELVMFGDFDNAGALFRQSGTYPIELQGNIEFEAEMSALMFSQTFESGTSDFEGRAEIELFFLGLSTITIDFIFDGSGTISFSIDPSDQTGTIDLETGEVTFDE